MLGVSGYSDITPTSGGARLEAIGLRLRVVAVVRVMGCRLQELKIDVRVLLHSRFANRVLLSEKSRFVVFGM